MNKRQKKKQLKMRNKKLIERYPFLLPRNVWTGKVVRDYDYTWTEYDCIPKGWQIGFGQFLLEDLRNACLETDFLNKLQFMQIKEKYAELRMYTNGTPQEVHDVIHKYEFLSHYICIECGSPYAQVVDHYGWWLPLCEDCWNKQNKNLEERGYKVVSWNEAERWNEEYNGIPNEYEIKRYSNKKEETLTYDISDTVEKIKKKFEKRKK